MGGDSKYARMNRAGAWTFLWVLWLVGAVQGGMLQPDRPYFILTILVTGVGLLFVGFHWYRYFTYKKDHGEDEKPQ